MRFDWRSFCTAHGIPFVTSGPNTARGRISIKCPYCGQADPSQHMGLSTDVNNPVWGCFRNAAHRGCNPRRLVQRLLNSSYVEAQRIVGEQDRTADESELEQAMRGLRNNDVEAAALATPLEWPLEFRLVVDTPLGLNPDDRYRRQFLDYLGGRGFDNPKWLCWKFGLYYALTGDYAWRLIFPIRGALGMVLGWTGRDIRKGVKLRYKTSPALPQDSAYNVDIALESGRRKLVIVEGPVDALKVHAYSGAAAIATLGTALPSARRAFLARLVREFEEVVLCLDEDAWTQAAVLQNELAEASGSQVSLLRPGSKDPGSMSSVQIKEAFG